MASMRYAALPSTARAAVTRCSVPQALPAFALRTLIAALVLLVAVPAAYAESASTSANPTCWQVSRETLAQYSSVNGNTATLVVPSWACPVEVSFSTYSLPGGEILPYEEQVLYDNVTDTYGPGTYHLTLDAPDCAYQSDLYLGEVIYPLTAGAHHNHNGTNYLVKYDVTNVGQTCDTPPPPGDVCDSAEDDCLQVELLGVTTNDDGTLTYNVRITYNCHKGLSYAALQLPEGVEAISYSTGWPITGVENPGGTGGWHNPNFRNIKFEFGGDIKNGESVELSYTLPAGTEFEDGLRVQTKGGRYTQKVTLDPSACAPPPPPPGDVCDSAEDDCLQVELLGVTTNDDGTLTYNVRITYNCHKDLDKAYLELPEGVEAVSYSTGWPIVDVDNPGDRGGWYHPDYNNIEFEFGGGIDNGESVELSYTLPAGTGYIDGLRVRTWGGWHKQNVTLDPSACAPPPPPPPPPGEVCDMAEDGCMKTELIGVDFNDDGTLTYNVRITYNCHKDLHKAFFQLPEGVEAVSYSTGGLIAEVYNPGPSGGWFFPDYNNIAFRFNDGIDQGDSVELSYTLPAGASYDDGLRVQTWGGWYKQNVTLDPSACTDPCALDAGPPEVSYSMSLEGETQYVDVVVTDDTGLSTITYEVTDNLAVEGTPFEFDPGDLEATARFRIISLDPSLLNEVRVQATDLCDLAACEDETPPVFTGRIFLLVDDETGTVIPYVDPPRPDDGNDGYDRIGVQLGVEEDVELRNYQLFAIQNLQFLNQPDPDCADPLLGCPINLSGPLAFDFILEEIVPNTGGRYGLLVADACNASVYDPAFEGGEAGRGTVGTSTASGGSQLNVPAGMLGADVEGASAALPTVFAVSPNYPNPFSGATSITVDLPEPTELRIEVYNVLGQRVQVLADGMYEAGRETFRFEATGLASGTYIYRVATPEHTAVHRMTVAN